MVLPTNDITSIVRETSGNVLFYAGTEVVAAYRETKELRRTGNTLFLMTETGDKFEIDVRPITLLEKNPTTTLSLTALPTIDGDPALVAAKVNTVYEWLVANIFKACCPPATPTFVGSLVVAYPDLATLQASAPGTEGVLYTTTDTNLLYWWDAGAAAFEVMSGVQYYANFAAFPVTGEEKVLYYDIADQKLYLWVSGAYVALCCPAASLVQKYTQVAHGFSVGDAVYISGTNTFALAQADAIGTSYVVGIVSQVVDPDIFVLTHSGYLNAGVPAVAAGTVMYLSETTAGALTSTPPSAPDIERPVLVVLENAVSALVFLSLVDPNAGTSGVLSVSGESVDNTDPANPVVNAWPLAGTGVDLANGTIFAQNLVALELIKQVDGSGDRSVWLELNQGMQMLLRFINLASGTEAYALSGEDGALFTYATSAGGYAAQSGISINVHSDSGTYPYIFLFNKRHQLVGVSAPSINDDSSRSYAVNSLWIYDGRIWICTDATTGAAVWNEVGAGGGGVPAGSDTQVQFNDGGAFGADSGLTFDKTNNILSVNEAGPITVNGAAITSHVRVAGTDGLTDVEIEAHRHSATASAGASILGVRSRGTETSPTAVNNGDRLLTITAAGFDGNDYATGAQIDFEVSAAPSSNDMPTDIIFKTASDGTQALVERLRINAAGNVVVANDLDASNVTVDDEAYGAGWNGSVEVPTKNALYDKIETLPQQDSMILSNGQGNSTVGAGVTTYANLFGGLTSFSTTESSRQSLVTNSGNISRLYVRTSNTQPGTGALVFTLRVNGVDTALTVTVAANAVAGTFSDTVNSVAVNAGDLISLKLVNGASGTSAQTLTVSALFTR